MNKIHLPKDRLISMAELTGATAALVEPDANVYAVTEPTRPHVTGSFSPQKLVAGMHRVALLEALEAGTVTARSLGTRVPFREYGRIDSDWERTSKAYGLTHEDAVKFLEMLAITPATGSQEAEAAPAVQAAPEQTPQQPEIDYKLLATPAQLIKAFGSFSGMNQGWFRSPKDRPPLKAAIKVPGVRGRNGAPPLLDVFEVAQYLMEPMRNGRQVSEKTAWRLLKNHFPQVHAHNESRAPEYE